MDLRRVIQTKNSCEKYTRWQNQANFFCSCWKIQAKDFRDIIQLDQRNEFVHYYYWWRKFLGFSKNLVELLEGIERIAFLKAWDILSSLVSLST